MYWDESSFTLHSPVMQTHTSIWREVHKREKMEGKRVEKRSYGSEAYFHRWGAAENLRLNRGIDLSGDVVCLQEFGLWSLKEEACSGYSH